MLSDFLVEHRESLIDRARDKVLLRRLPLPTDFELQHGVPLFLDQLSETLRMEAAHLDTLPKMGPGAILHARDLLAQGFTIGQVVHDYGDICQAVTELASEVSASITTQEFHTLNRCLDDVTAEAVTEYGRRTELAAAGVERERVGQLVDELRNLVQSAVLSFQILRRGAVGIAGTTGKAHERTLRGLSDLVEHAQAEVRLNSKVRERVRFQLWQLIEEVAFPANLEAGARGVTLVVVPPTGHQLEVEADRQLLRSAISNVLQNAFKFTKHGGRVELRTHSSPERVTIEIEDACGGLPPGKAKEIFKQPFSLPAADRAGVGTGLSIAFRAVEQAGGTIAVRNLAGKGCIFTIELPLLPKAPDGRIGAPQALNV